MINNKKLDVVLFCSLFDVGSVGFFVEDKVVFVVIDYDCLVMILVGSVFIDVEIIKKVLVVLMVFSVLF